MEMLNQDNNMDLADQRKHYSALCAECACLGWSGWHEMDTKHGTILTITMRGGKSCDM